jgi:integrase
MELPNPISPRVQQPPIISWEEQLHDHNQKIEEYLQNRVFRGCTYESTVKSARTVLKRLFDLVPIPDPNHPDGHRHILVWEFLDPVRGSSRFGVLMSSLLQGNLAYGTRRRYLTELRAFCDYVVAKPNIPGSSNLTIIEKYGPIALPFTKYDLPVHAQDRPTKPRYALSAEVRDEFYEFLRTEHLPNHPVPHLGAQDYVAIVLQTEIGARTSELLGIRSSGASCDIDWQAGRVRLFGKAKAFSGKRVRTVPLTAFAMEVLRVFEKVFKPMFPRRGDESEYLFLDKDGDPLMDHQYIYNFRKIVELAREAGVPLPEDLRPHDLRRTCATLALEQNPLEYRKVLRKLGHTYPSSAAPYLIATDADVEDEQGDLIDIFIDPDMEKRGTK